MRFLFAIVLLASAAQAQSLNARGVARLNADIASVWSHDGASLAQSAAQAEAQKLVGLTKAITSKLAFTIVGVNHVTLSLPGAPGLRRFDATGVDAALPLAGSWSADVELRIHLKGKVLFIGIDDTFNVTVKVRNLSAQMSASIDSSDPAAPKLVSAQPPQIHFNISITSSNTLVSFLGLLASGLVDGPGKAVVAAAADYVAAKLDLFAQSNPSVMNSGGPALAPIRRGDLEAAAATLGDEVQQYRTPFGPLIELHFDKLYAGTWGESLRDPGFSPGNVTGPHAYGDSGEWTGHYLATLAFEYASTRSATAKTRAQRALGTMRTLLTMRGEPGNMNRSIMPLWYLPADQRPSTTYTPGQDYAAMWNGELHYFSDYMSRDEYLGMFYGLTVARDLFDDPAMKASAQGSIEMALDYLVRNGWTWRRHDGSYGERWAGVMEEQYAWILSAWHGNPAKYQGLHDQYQGFADIIWTGIWTSAIDPFDQYYKFQLGTGAMYVLLQHETDPAAWMRAYQGIAIQRHYIGHHLNAYFNALYLAFDPASRAALGAENTNLLSRWLNWPRRRQRVDLHGDPAIPKTTYTPPLGAVANPQPVEIAKYPLPPDQRIGDNNMFSSSPVRLDPGFPVNPDYYIEGETMDYLLSYWMSRYYGAVVPPSTTWVNPN